MPEQTKQTARTVVAQGRRRAGAAGRADDPGRGDRRAQPGRADQPAPRTRDIDWDRTIRANLKHYQPEHRTVVPERLVGYGRRDHRGRSATSCCCVDQSGSMAASVVYSGVFARGARVDAVAADVAGGLRHRGGRPDRPAATTRSRCCSARSSAAARTSTGRIAYGQGLVTRPRDTIFVLISDLYEGGVARRDAAPGRRDDRGRRPGRSCCSRCRTRARPPTTTRTRRRWPPSACRPSPARRTCSPS